MKIEALICLVLNINLDCLHTGYSTQKTTEEITLREA